MSMSFPRQSLDCVAERCDHTSTNTDNGPFTGTPPTYGYDADRAEEQRRHHDILPYIDDSPSSSPYLSSKSRSSRDTLSSGSLESAKSVSPQSHQPRTTEHRFLSEPETCVQTRPF
ncbi:hypothetical protein MHYP_G00208100 [Metynnis hypsauchen]